MDSKITILMATYNGAKYLKEQLDSIINQSYSDFVLYISDDGSSDRTLDIIKEYIERDDRIKLELSSHKGACQNFAQMIRNHKDAEYIMLCDQDDVWDRHKVEKSLTVIQQSDNDKPILLYCDKVYVDERLQPLEIIIRKYSDTFKSLLCQCHIYGCTVMINKQLIDLVDIPSYASMHDHWIALVAACEGKIIHLEESLILYRQHTANVTGGINQFSLKKKLENWSKISKEDEKAINMCYRFSKDHLYNTVASDYTKIFSKNGLSRIYKAIKFGYKLDHTLATVRGLYEVMMADISEG